MKKKPGKQESKMWKELKTDWYDAGFEDGRRYGLAEASNVLMTYRDENTGTVELPEKIFDAPR